MKNEIILLARELFKIRISSSREGFSQDDGMHKLTVKGITSFNRKTISQWYKEALEIAEIVVILEHEYLNKKL